MKKYLLTLPLMAALMMPGWAFAEDHDEDMDMDDDMEMEMEMDEDMEFDEEEFETIEQEVMSYIKSIEPRAVPVMEAWGDSEAEEGYYETLFEIHQSMDEIEELNEEAPEWAKLYNNILGAEIKLEYLAHAIEESESDSERSKLEAELKELLPKAFEDRMKEAEMEITMLREELAEVEADMKKRKANKEKIIEKRFNDLTGKDAGLEW